jgi:gamma-glutamylcyclotransferase (GGCT)/AIG2-like uncharacterized protein YtfP
MPPLLFVYGSLLSTIAHPQGERLRREATLVDAATLAGVRLYRVSWYPAASETGDEADNLFGEVYRLATPMQTLAWLDAYEGITAGTGEYERVVRAVTLTDGRPLDAMLYLYRWPVEHLEPIASGRWTG